MLENNEPCAEENRKAAEQVAHLLLDRLRNENSFYGKSTAPWQDAVVIHPEAENIPWTEDHDRMLRNQVSKLKGQRSFIQNTVVNLESPFNVDEINTCSSSNSKTESVSPTKTRSRSRNKNMDLETAILMQELCELKYQAEQSEKEKVLAHEKLKSLQSALIQLQSQLNESESKPKDRFSYTEAEYNASIERELLEALSRECRLKARLQSLAGTINSSTKQNTELKQTNLT
jgi:hypothetical protein